MGDGAIRIRPLREDDFPTIAALFGERGASSGCWCMWWRVPRGGKTWEAARGAPNRRALRTLVEGGRVHALLAFAGDRPVGWCNYGPRGDFPRLETVRAIRREWGPTTWSINCFYVAAGWRRRGVARALLDEATRRAFAAGATEIEGYPIVVVERAGYTGTPAMFARAGYEDCGGSVGKRLMIRRLAAAPRRTPARRRAPRSPTAGR
jgi:ribosomal protein S18 acetylase RimI-like enzyme